MFFILFFLINSFHFIWFSFYPSLFLIISHSLSFSFTLFYSLLFFSFFFTIFSSLLFNFILFRPFQSFSFFSNLIIYYFFTCIYWTPRKLSQLLLWAMKHVRTSVHNHQTLIWHFCSTILNWLFSLSLCLLS